MAELANRPVKDSSILDVGCGTGDLSEYWRMYSGGRYLGIDIYLPSLQIAEHIHPREEFRNCEVFDVQEKFDFTYCSGPLTTRVGNKQEQLAHVDEMVRAIWERSQNGAYLNYLVADNCWHPPVFFHYEPGQIKEVCEGIVGADGKVMEEINPIRNEGHLYLLRN